MIKYLKKVGKLKFNYKKKTIKKITIFFNISIMIISYAYYLYKFNLPLEKIFQNIKIYSKNDTLNELIFKNKSISRFGDGEFTLIYGEGNLFQDCNKIISKKLIKILRSNEKNLLIGINIPYTNKSLERYIDIVKEYYYNLLNKKKHLIFKLLDKNKEYYSSDITRFYMDFKNKSYVPNYIKTFKKLWEKKDIVIIEGEKSRLGVGNDLFDNSKSIKRILCPAKNAFKVIKKITNEVINKIDRKSLILLALGPTATILAYDLYKLGYQVVDVGHIDIEYEWFLKNASNKIIIKNKYIAEINGDNNNFTDVKDKRYYNQIIAKILN